VHLFWFCTVTNKCTFISQIITLDTFSDSVHSGPARQYINRKTICTATTQWIHENKCNVYGLVHRKYIPIYGYTQQDATLHSLFISGNCSTCFGWYFHPSSGALTTVSTASGICHTVSAACHYRGGGGTGLSVLWVAYATHSTLKPVPTLPG